MRRRLATLTAVTGLALLAAPTLAQAANSGAITGVTIDAVGTTVQIQNVRVQTDSCPIFDEFAGMTTCGAEAGLVPAAQTCPAQGAGMIHLWSAQRAATGTGRTMNSGQLAKVVPTRGQYRVCAYLARESENFGESIIFVTEALSPTPPPMPDPDPQVDPPANPPTAPTPMAPAGEPAVTLGARKAATATRTALTKQFGKRWRKGSNRKVKCSRLSSTKLRCKATWRYDGKRRKASVLVTRTAAGDIRSRVL